MDPALAVPELPQVLSRSAAGDEAAAMESELAAGELALLQAADLAAARRHFAAAGRAALAVGDPHAFGRAALGLGGLWVHEQRTAVDSSRVAAWLRKAQDGLPVDAPLAARLRTRLAAEEDYAAGTSAGVLACLTAARAAGDPVALAEALNLAHHCLLGPQHAELRLTLAEELLATAAMTGRTLDELLGLLWWTVDLFLSGDAHAERCRRELTTLAAAHPLRAVDFVLSAQEGMLAIRRGDFTAAEAQASACKAYGHQAGDLDAVGWYAAQLVTVRWFQGRIGELRDFLAELVHSPTLAVTDNSLFTALAVAAATAGDRATAVTALRTVRGGSLTSLRTSSTWLVTLAGIAEAAALVGDVGAAAEAYVLLEPYAHLPVMASLGVSCFGSAHHALGVAALATGDLKRAAEHLDAAVAANERLGHRPAAELSRRRLAEVRALSSEREVDRRATCRREQSGWRVTTPVGSVHVPDSVGLRYLSVLLDCADQEVPAVQLAGGSDLKSSGDTVLDDEARRTYGRRIEALRVELDRADAAEDAARSTRAEAELRWVLTELDKATGLRGRPRRFADQAERARTSVQKALWRAIDRITALDPSVGRYLAAGITTGTVCRYRPTPPS